LTGTKPPHGGQSWTIQNLTRGDSENESLSSIKENIKENIKETPALSEKEKKDILKNSDPAWSLLAGQDVEQEQVDTAKLEKDAFDTFERDLQLPGTWYWHGKGSEDKALADLRAFVVEQYVKDPKCFEKYNTWRNQPYSKGTMSNLALKRFPENFRASWSDFLASNSMYGKKGITPSKPAVDDNGVPVTY
jgi:hypothetical protein